MSEPAYVRSLRFELAALRVQVEDLTAQVAELQADRGFEVVHSWQPAGETTATATTSAAVPETTESYLARAALHAPSAAAASGGLSLTERESICIEIGQHISRSLRGLNRGESGRKKLKLASRLYLVFKDSQGVVHNPCKVHYRWSAVKDDCARSGDFGDSVFIGLPSLFDARIVCQTAGVALPV